MRHQPLGGLLAGAGAQLHPGGVEIGIDGLWRYAETLRDLLAAIAIDHIAKAVPLTIGEKVDIRPRPSPRFSHLETLERDSFEWKPVKASATF